ncbi:MAG: hypothetical protein ACXWB9_01000 [Flavisolibacter sp.]
MKYLSALLLTVICVACNNNQPGNQNEPAKTETKNAAAVEKSSGEKTHWEGAFTNGMKETFISFDVSADGTKLENLTFSGYWRCDGSLTKDILGPEKSFTIQNNKVDGSISEPEDGGATAIRYELHATFEGSKASGSFRMNINALACDTYLLQWTAAKK